MKGTILVRESYWVTGLIHKVLGCVTQTKKTRGERKQDELGWGGLLEESAMQEWWVRTLQARGTA